MIVCNASLVVNENMADIATLDFPDDTAGTRRLLFDAPIAFAAEALLVWDSARTASRYEQATSIEGWQRVLTPNASMRLVRDVRRWSDAFAAQVAQGATLVVFAPGDARVGLHTLQEVVDFSFVEPLAPLCPIEDEPSPAGPVAAVGGEPFARFFATFGPRLVATRTLVASSALTIATGPSGRPCALYRTVHPGRVLVLPTLVAPLDRDAVAELLDGLVTLARRLDGRAIGATTAASRRAASPEETALHIELEGIDASGRSLAARRRAILERLDVIAILTSLDSGDPGAAARAAALVLHALGAYVQQGVDRPGSLMLEAAGGVGLLIALGPDDDPSDPRALAPDLYDVAAGWTRGDAPVVTCLVTGAASATMAGPLRHVTGEALLAAYRAHDVALLARLTGS